MPPASSLFSRDLRRLHKHAAALGVMMAIVCHLPFLPEHYKAACRVITALCRAH